MFAVGDVSLGKVQFQLALGARMHRHIVTKKQCQPLGSALIYGTKTDSLFCVLCVLWPERCRLRMREVNLITAGIRGFICDPICNSRSHQRRFPHTPKHSAALSTQRNSRVSCLAAHLFVRRNEAPVRQD